MQLHTMIVDDFLGDFDEVRKWLDTAQFEDIQNPVDGVVYPAICKDLPQGMQDEILFKLQLVLGGKVDLKMIFARLSVDGVPVPHQAHNDCSHGMFSFMLYMNRPEHIPARGAGTELVTHYLAGMEYGPSDEFESEVWNMDMNARDRWDVKSLLPMKANRAAIFDARLMHRAAPIGGFGKDPTDGRMVITAFFDL